jgi:thiamine-phosphate pyrophosphorylase
MPKLAAVLNALPVACLHLKLGSTDHAAMRSMIQSLAPPAQDKGAAVLIDPPSDLREIARWGVDGVHISTPDNAKAALEELKPDRIVGVGGLKSRDAAMTVGELGADYMMFGEPRPDGTLPPLDQVVERCRWWAEVFNVPCVGYAPDLAAVQPLASTGAEFVALGSFVFEPGVAEAVAKLLKPVR